MLKWLIPIDDKRIQKLEKEVQNLKQELQHLKQQNKAMIKYIENINNYEKELIQKLEELTKDLSAHAVEKSKL